MSTRNIQEGSVGSALLWMVGLSILLFWLPTIGPLVAGFVGGRKAGGVGPALVAAIIPAVLVAVLILLLGALPVIGALVGAGIFFVILFESVPLLIGPSSAERSTDGIEPNERSQLRETISSSPPGSRSPAAQLAPVAIYSKAVREMSGRRVRPAV